MQPDCVCKARFFSKNVLISAKKMCRFQAIFAVFHRLSEDFQQCFPQFVERRKSPEISEIFLGVGNLSQPVFHENPIFCFNSFNMRIFKKFFAVRFSSSFPQNFQQVFLFNSTIFQLFKMSNVDSTFQHKFNNCTVKKKISGFAIFLTFPPFQQPLLLLLIFLIFLFYQNDTHRTANTIATVETFHNF